MISVNSRVRLLSWLLVCLVVPSAGCSNQNAATVGGLEIARKALDRELEAIGGNEKYVSHLVRKTGFLLREAKGRFTPPLIAQVVTNMIRRAVAMDLFRDRGLRSTAAERRQGLLTAQGAVGSPDTLDAFPQWFKKVLVDYEVAVIALSRSLEGATPEQYYRRAKDAFVRACAWHIATETEEEALAARQRIEGGASFESVAKSASRDEKTASKGGELGCVGRGDLQIQLDELAFSLDVGEVSEPVNIGGAFHLLMVSSRKPPPLKEIPGEVRSALRRLGASRYDAMMKETLASADVSVAKDIGVWDAGRLMVLPPALEQRGRTPTPLPRPLPQVAVSSDQVDPNYQVGQQAFITDDGFKPRELVSIIDEEITWTNETDAPQTIRFVAGGRTIGPIGPGEKGSYTPDGTYSIAYTLADDPDVKGLVQVQWYYAPGEDPGAPNRFDADSPLPGTPSPRPTQSPG